MLDMYQTASNQSLFQEVVPCWNYDGKIVIHVETFDGSQLFKLVDSRQAKN